MSHFYQLLAAGWQTNVSLLCVGLDPDLHRLPPCVAKDPDPLGSFNRAIIDATIDLVCAYKLQLACYSAYGLESQAEQTIAYIKSLNPQLPVILDAKRGDIGATAKMYAREAFERYGADAVTVNPYMGGDTLTPFLDYAARGVIVLCRTSNPGSGEFQALESHGQPLYLAVAERASGDWNYNHNVALVVGATYPEMLGEVRQQVGDMPILVPGIGTQGGDIAAVLKHGLAASHPGLIINVSRAIIYAADGEADDKDFAAAARQRAQHYRTLIEAHRP